MKVNFIALFFVFTMIAIPVAWAAETVDMHRLTIEGTGEKIGTVTVSDTDHGTLFTPDITGLSPGLHGFHVHEKGECGPGEKDGKMVPGLAAGGHYNPDNASSHKGPYEENHKGDLPALYVDPSGAATHPVLAPKIKLSELKGHALIIHQGGDNYSDTPEKLGGGGSRIACGVFK
jgi:Cu-Zn family superoxide dismutase